MEAAYTHAQVKAAMKSAGIDVSEGDQWSPEDTPKFKAFIFAAGQILHREGSRHGDPYSIIDAFKGFASAAVPVWLTRLIHGSAEHKEDSSDSQVEQDHEDASSTPSDVPAPEEKVEAESQSEPPVVQEPEHPSEVQSDQVAEEKVEAEQPSAEGAGEVPTA